MNIFPHTASKTSRGFTLAETIVVVAITGALMVSVTTLFKDIFVDSRQGTVAENDIDQARLFSNNFVNEIRNATNGVDGSFPLVEAGNSEIIFFTTYNTGGTVNRIRYYVSGTTLYKGVIVPTGTPANYSGTERVTAILNNVTNGTGTPAFYYYNGNYSGSSGSPLSQTVNVNSVNFVQLNLSILKEDALGSTSTFSIKDGATIRELKTNLGN